MPPKCRMPGCEHDRKKDSRWCHAHNGTPEPSRPSPEPITARDLFAAAVLPHVMTLNEIGRTTLCDCGRRAYEMADLLLEARDQTPNTARSEAPAGGRTKETQRP